MLTYNVELIYAENFYIGSGTGFLEIRIGLLGAVSLDQSIEERTFWFEWCPDNLERLPSSKTALPCANLTILGRRAFA